MCLMQKPNKTMQLITRTKCSFLASVSTNDLTKIKQFDWTKKQVGKHIRKIRVNDERSKNKNIKFERIEIKLHRIV